MVDKQGKYSSYGKNQCFDAGRSSLSIKTIDRSPYIDIISSTNKSVMKCFTTKHSMSYFGGLTLILVILTSIAFAQNTSVVQPSGTPEEFVKVPDNLIVDGVRQIPVALRNEIEDSIYRNYTSFFKWSEVDNSLIGISPDAKLFYRKSPKEKPVIEDFSFHNPTTTFLQPKLEKNLLYLKDKDGNQLTQLYRYNIDAKKTSSITDSSQFEKIGWATWSTDGKKFYFSNHKKKENISEIYVCSPDNEKPSFLISFPNDSTYVVKASNKYLITKAFTPKSHIYILVDLTTFERTEIASDDRLIGGDFNADESGVWFFGNNNTDLYDLYFYKLIDKTSVKVGLPGMMLLDYSFSKSEKMLAVKTEEGGSNSIRVFELNGTSLVRELPGPQLPPGIIEHFNWRDDEELGFDFNSTKLPSSIKSYNAKTGKISDWTKTDSYPAVGDRLNDVKLIKWVSFDKREISGYMIEPKQSVKGKLPVVIQIHGGPYSVSKPGYDGYYSYLAATLPAVVIFPNIRGSTGFGRAFEKLDDRTNREHALKDLQKLVEWISKQPNLDSNKIAVRGSSYGGFMALALAMREQKKVKGVVASVPLISIKNFLGFHSENLRKLWVSEFGDVTNEKEMITLEHLSILNDENLRRWKTPTLLIAGENDPLAPASDVEKLYSKLKEKKLPVSYLRARNLGHGLNEYNSFIFEKLSEYMFIKTILK